MKPTREERLICIEFLDVLAGIRIAAVDRAIEETRKAMEAGLPVSFETTAAFMADNEYEIAVGRSDAWDEIYWGRA